MEFDDDDAGEVSEDLLQQFNNPDSFVQVEFSGSADIELLNADKMWDEGWDGQVTLIAKVQDANLSYRLVWEANDHDDRGWFTVGSGEEYSYTLTKANLRHITYPDMPDPFYIRDPELFLPVCGRAIKYLPKQRNPVTM